VRHSPRSLGVLSGGRTEHPYSVVQTSAFGGWSFSARKRVEDDGLVSKDAAYEHSLV
jgi:hypothetical protein